MPPYINLVGKRFGRLVVLSLSRKHDTRPDYIWQCRCDCGALKETVGGYLRSGDCQSCGCLRKERTSETHVVFIKHGLSRSSEYRTWHAMKQRCYNLHSTAWQNYGGRGISICERWLTSFSAFYEDMGPKPTPQHSIERRDNDGPYSPDNCYWATPSEQNRNRRNPNIKGWQTRRQRLSH